MFTKFAVTFFFAPVILLASGFAVAATASTTIPVTSAVSKNCQINLGTGIAFVTYDPLVTNLSVALTATGSITVACTKGATGMTIGMNNGLHVAVAQRQMLGGANAGMLQYNVFQPPSNTPGAVCIFPGTTAWTTTGGGLLTLSAATSKDTQTYNVCGTIPGGQDVAVDSYSDTITATVNF